MEQLSVDVENDRFVATVTGNGTSKAILLHGWIADSRLLYPLMTALADKGFQTATFDMRGYGARLNSGGPYDHVTMANDALALADALGWQKFDIIGHSMGGFAAQYLANIAQERLSGMALVCPVPATGAKLDQARQLALNLATQNADQRQALIAANSSGQMPEAQVRAILKLSLTSTAPDRMRAYIPNWSDGGFFDSLRPQSIPTIVIMGDDDPGAHPAKFKELYQAWLPRAQLALISGQGHYGMWSAPEQVAALISKKITNPKSEPLKP